MDKRGDNQEYQDMPYRDVVEKPVMACQAYKIEEFTHQETKDKRTYQEIKLVKRYPVLAAVFAHTSFEETLDDISK